MPAFTNVRFKQVDVFSSTPFKGNPLAVVFDADGLTSVQMQAIANWTNLSETAFLSKPTDPQADYRVRIFTTVAELPFAGHPTLGAAHALLESGYQPKQAGKLVQQCGAGLVDLALQDNGDWAFSAPRADVTALPPTEYDALALALNSDQLDLSAMPCAVDNGASWLVVRMKSAQACLTLTPESLELARITARVNAHGIALYGPHEADGPATFEMRCLLTGTHAGPTGLLEDPVTGSANAALAGLLAALGKAPGTQYTVRQGTALGRAGNVTVRYEKNSPVIWVSGPAVTIVDGTFKCPVAKSL
ncbi:PhzF family phenazine biosynthesis protein [Paraburkholderia bonniea]|uniref:PhzF family phenazine biosynthesis protein n=1 Tax=Paraburkholderia bonniea TaxID=2152891 RepID=UPI001291D53F|nr:PhzF family phenazine biosynthesis protein [Paraburkholderia bonniea]WJF91684.1 PhzF family phenazine biosynthesis protein [Paraburkholderia bonniea]WJF95003.1 PhzF family phenazine biosynthesis protein [Paraburkholderia bonniea]